MAPLSGKDDPTTGIERYLEKALLIFANQISSQLAKPTPKSNTNRESSLNLLPLPYQKLIVISNCRAIKSSSAFQNVSLDSINSLEQSVLLSFIQEESEIILHPLLKCLGKGESFIYRLLRELSEVDRQVREIDKSLVKTILSSLTFITIKGLADQIQLLQTNTEFGKVAWRDGIIMKSVLAPIIIQEAFDSLGTFLECANYREEDGGTEGQLMIEKFKTENAILVSIFTDI